MSMARTYKTVGFSLPPRIVERIEEATKTRNMTKSELFREMFRVWDREDQRKANADEELIAYFAKVKEEARKNPTPLEVDMEFYKEIGNDLQRRAKERGLVVTDDGEIIEAEEIRV